VSESSKSADINHLAKILPNGFHDSKIEEINWCISKKVIEIELLYDRSNHSESSSIEFGRALIKVYGSESIVSTVPQLNYGEPLCDIGPFDNVVKSPLPEFHGLSFWIYMGQTNSFIYIFGDHAELQLRM